MRLTFATALAAVAVLTGCGSGGTTSAIPAGDDTSAVKSTATTTAAAETAPAGCTAAEKPQPKEAGSYSRPTFKLNGRATYLATVKTNCGAFVIKLDVRHAPNAAASIYFLASKKYFDNTIFHRIVPDFVIQGGDPTQSGRGGPGYSTVDKPPRSAAYTRGVVAMAKTGSEAAGTVGSQFFVVTGADAGLPPDYAILGKVSKGMAAVTRIGKLGDQSEKPTTNVVIQSLRVKRAAS